MGSAEEQAKHELRKDESRFAVLLRAEDPGTRTWPAVDLQVRSRHNERV